MASPLRTVITNGAAARPEQGLEVVRSCSVCRSERIQKLDPHYNLCRCESCGYVFDSPRPTAAAVSAFYSRPVQYDSWIEQERERDALWSRRLKRLLPHKAEGNLLDIGAGIGQFLHHARTHFTKVAGTEISESAARIAKQKYGIDLHVGQIEEINLPPVSCDNITLFHVLEHVPDPAQLIDRCRDLLRPRGVLVVAVPNDVRAWTSKIKKLGRKTGLAAFQKFSPVLGIARAGESREIHLSHFTPAVLRQLVKNTGLEIVEESLDSYYVSSGVRLILDSAYYGLHKMIYSMTKANYYDTIWMVARKP